MDKFIYGIVICGLFVTGCNDTKPLKASNPVKVERSIPHECIDEDGQFNEDLGTDTLDCGNLPR